MRGRRTLWLAVIAAAGLTATACSSGSSGTNAGSAPDSHQASSGVVAKAQATVDTFYKGAPRALPSTGPKAQTGKTVWVIANSAKGAGSEEPAEQAITAAKAIGWKVRLLDGQSNPTVITGEIDSAISAHVDGMILSAVDCPTIKGALSRAKAAAVKVFAMATSFDCNDPIVGSGQGLYAASLNTFGSVGNLSQFIQDELEQPLLSYIIAKGGPKAKIINLEETDFNVVKAQKLGWDKIISQCPGCTVWNFQITYNDLLSGTLANKVSSALAKHPDAEWLVVPYDTAFPLGVTQALTSSRSTIKTVTTAGTQPGLALLKQGKITMDVYNSSVWNGWAAVDGLNRVFAGAAQVDSGLSTLIMDADHNLPTAVDQPKQPADFVANYKKIWGIAG